MMYNVLVRRICTSYRYAVHDLPGERTIRPSGAGDRTALPIAGDAAAKAATTAFLDSIGYDAVDGGSLADSWRQEPGTPVYGNPYGPFSDEMGTPAGSAHIRTDLIAAHR